MTLPDEYAVGVMKDAVPRRDATSLISPLVADVILANIDRRDTRFAEAVPAIVLCADIAGFSIAGAALMRSEARGAEELRIIVNAVFDRVTQAIESVGGKILQFSGDAVTAAWPCRQDRASQALRAIHAGLGLQDACRTLAVAGMTGLHLRVSLTEGPVWIAHLAKGAIAPQTVICGEVFGRFRGQSGFSDGVLVDAPLWSDVAPRIARMASVVAEEDGTRVLALNEPQAEPERVPPAGPDRAGTIASYVPEYLRNLLTGTLTDWLAEFRSSHICSHGLPGSALTVTPTCPSLPIWHRGSRGRSTETADCN